MNILKGFYDKVLASMMRAAMDYNTVYGSVELIETERHYLMWFHNGGWSENESIDTDLKLERTPAVDNHPYTLYSFQKAIIDHYNPSFKDWFRSSSHYTKENNYSITVDFN